jgi:KaiC/GvpD/RAD55 family RecA-like ATPase
MPSLLYDTGHKTNDSSIIEDDVNFVIVEGEPGMGRSNAAHFFRSTALQASLKCISVQARHGDETVSYGVYKKIIWALVPPKFKTENGQKEILSNLLLSVMEDVDAEEIFNEMLSKLKIFLGIYCTYIAYCY